MKQHFFSVLLSTVGVVATSCVPEPPATSSYFFAHRVAESDGDFDDARFRSFRKDGRLATMVALGDLQAQSDSRYSLVPPVSFPLGYHVTVPADARLDFEIGVAVLGDEVLPAPVVFAIEVDNETVFERTIRRRFGNEWTPGSVNLTQWSGDDVTITFETRFSETAFIDATRLASEGRGILPAWGHPVLGGGGGDTSPNRPDLILVSIDCLRADHVGAYGHEPPTTPNIDAFAADGALFENTASVSSWTLPTHMSMLTGLMPTEHGLNRARKRGDSVPYLPEILSREGYETIGVVSGLYLSPTFGYDQGFDVYRALIDQPAEALVDAAKKLFLAEPRRPRFLFLHFFDAHWPYLPDAEYLEQAGVRPPDISDLLHNVIEGLPPKNDGEIEGTKTLYDGEVAYVDHHLGRFFEALTQRGLYDDALIVLTADHGEGFYEHSLWQHSEIIYNEVTRVPLIVKEPRGERNVRVSGRVSQLGIFPTFLEATGLKTPFDHPGLVALAKGDAPFPERVTSEIIWEANETRGPFLKLAATEQNLKYVATFAGDLDDEKFVSRLITEELYDLSSDPGEQLNLLPDHGGDIGKLRSHVRSYLELVQQQRSDSAGDRIVIEEELAKKLRALGYAQ